MAELTDEVRAECVEAVAKIAWAEMTQDGSGLPSYENLPQGMLAPLRARVRQTLAPVFDIIERSR